MPHIPDVLIDGYISQSFRSNKDAENYICHLLKINQSGLRQSSLTLPAPNGSGVLFVARAAPDKFSSEPLMQDPSGYPLWLLDHSAAGIGTVVPQSPWSVTGMNELRQYIANASLQLPIFFTQEDGTLGLSLSDAAKGRCQTLRNAQMQAQLGGKVTTFIRVWWPGYNDFRRQVQIRDESPSKNPITIAKFARHVGRSVEVFFQDLTPSGTLREGDDRWVIGQNGIDPSNIKVIGAIHVSAGSWMPILQLSNVWVI